MKLTNEIHIRDPFVLPVPEEGKYYMFGTTDIGPGRLTKKFDAYVSTDLKSWQGPIPIFDPGESFWATHHFWAAEVHRYKGQYYLFGSFKAEGVRRATQILVAASPLGPFKPLTDRPITPPEWECLDGTLFIDDKGAPWIIFCHEWVQVGDGEICALRLTSDLRESVGKPVLLFRAGQAPWVRSFTKEGGYVTDGPFLHRASNGELLMLWSSFSKEGYCQAVAR